MTIITKDPTLLEYDGFGFDGPNSPTSRQDWWKKFPEHLKRRYLHLKVQRHTQSPCLFTSHVQEVLDISNNRTAKDKEALLDTIIDAFLCSRFTHPQKMLDPKCYTSCTEAIRARHLFLYESPAATLNTVLAIGAIIHGDAAELECIYLSTRMGIRSKSYRFMVMPLAVAARMGSEDVIRTIIKCWGNDGGRALRGSLWNEVAVISARAGNLKAIKLFNKHYQTNNGNDYHYHFLVQAARSSARAGKMDIIHYCVEESRGYIKYHELLFDTLIQAIKFGQFQIAEYLLDHGGFDINDITIQSWDSQKGALFTVLHDCPPEKRPAFMRLVLEHGVDPNGRYPIIPRTPFQAAVKLGDFRSAASLVEYGADVHAASLLSPPALMMPLLLQAIEHRSAPLVTLMLNNGVDRFCDWRRKRYTVHDGTVEGGLKGLVCELTSDQEEEQKVNYYVTVQRFSSL